MAPRKTKAPESRADLEPARHPRDVVDVVRGQPVTALDRAVETLSVGGYMTDVAARCGVRVEVVHEWRRVGARAAADLFAGRRTAGSLSAHERECVEFATETDRAEADGRLFLLALSDKLAQGGEQRTIVTEKVVGGNVVERTTKTETLLPDSAMIRWRLAARWPGDFGVRRVELTGAEGGPVEVEASNVDKLLSALDRIASTSKESEALRAGANGSNGSSNGHEA